MKLIRALSVLVLCALLAVPAAAAPNMMGYSGRLFDTDDIPYSGRHTFVAKMYTGATGGALVFEETFTDQLVDSGYFYLLLANNEAAGGADLDLIFATSDALYFELDVDGTTLSPRQRITSTPWSVTNGTRLDSIADATCSNGQMLLYDSNSNTFYCGGGGGGGVDPHTHDGADINTGTVTFDRLPTGTTSTTVAVGDHGHAAGSITSGTLAFERLPTGTTGNTVAVGNHGHSASDINSGTLAFGRLPTGTTATTVAVGNHAHSVSFQYLYASAANESILVCPNGGKVTSGECTTGENLSTKSSYPLEGDNTSAESGDAPVGWRCVCSDSTGDGTCSVTTRVFCVSY